MEHEFRNEFQPPHCSVHTGVIYTNPLLSFQQFVHKNCMTYSDLGASRKTQDCGLLIEQAFIVHLLCAR